MSMSQQDAVRTAEKLAKEHGGALPSATWLKDKYPGLYGVVRNRPELFAHLPKKCSVKDWVAVAEKLAKEHGGTLPSRLKDKFSKLAGAIRNHPVLFAHIPQKRSIKDWVTIGERLAKES